MTEHLDQAPPAAPAERGWALTVSGLLLFGQALLLALALPVLAADRLGTESATPWDPRVGPLILEWHRVPGPAIDLAYGPARVRLGWDALSAALFWPLVPLDILAGSLLLAVRRSAWMVAVFTQAVVLALCLALYVTLEPGYVYLVMLSGVLLVGYLNYEDVRIVFAGEEEEPAVIITGEEPVGR
jgi:hypothetical protein